MAEYDAQDRTEQPTARRLEKAREEGNVARSMELNSVAVLLAGLLALRWGGELIFGRISGLIRLVYSNLGKIDLTAATLPSQFRNLLQLVFPIFGPVLLVIMLAGLAVNFAQVGFFLTLKPLTPKIDRLSPLRGIKNLLSLRSLVELFKGLLKLAVVALITYTVLSRRLEDFWKMMYASISGLLATTGDVIYDVYLKVAIVLLFIAGADYGYQRWQHLKNLRMTKQEVKDEYKEYENPQIKGRIRSMQRQLARRRMMAAVPSATVVVTNPTFIAVALKYEPKNKSDAPVVVAKGQRKIAEKIRAIAQEHNIPIIENKPLARSLYESVDVGMEIPTAFYQAVAEILVQVYKMKRDMNPLRGKYARG